MQEQRMFQNILQYRGVRLQNGVVRWLGGRSGNIVPKPALGELLYVLSSMVLFMEDGGFYHDRHTATFSTNHVRNIGKHCRIRKHRQRQCENAGYGLCT